MVSSLSIYDYRIIFLLVVIGALGYSKIVNGFEESSYIEMTPQNSPVKKQEAIFLLKAPKELTIVQVKLKITNASKLFSNETSYSPFKIVDGVKGKEIHIPVESFNNGFYRLYARFSVKHFSNPRKSHEIKEVNYKNVYHDYVKFVVENKPSQVPEPDPIKNNSTLLGIDTDNDGVRDDVQNWINKKSSNPELRLAMRQMAMAIRNTLEFSTDKEKSNLAARAAIRAQDCHTALQRKFKNNSSSFVLIHRELDSFFTNTLNRINATRNSEKNFHGETVESVELDVNQLCDF